MALEMTPESTSKLLLNPQSPPTWAYKTERMTELFGTSYDADKHLREHVRWNLERAAGK
jgi:hypothetical protein